MLPALRNVLVSRREDAAIAGSSPGTEDRSSEARGVDGARTGVVPPVALIHQLVRRRQLNASPRPSLLNVSGRLHRRAVRRELPVASKATVLARHRAADAEPSLAAPQSAAAQASRRHDAAVHPAPAAPINVEALTGLVIQQLDRRLIAYRERMGRV
jgi:hypothetical protein